MPNPLLPNADINAAIAKSKGCIDKGDAGWFTPEGKMLPGVHPPNYTGSWEHAGPLWEGLVDEYGYNEACDLILEQLYDLDGKLTEAIARAWHAANVEGK